MSKTSQGHYFENIASTYLERIGYTIIEKNFYSQSGELDIISRLNSEIVFVEVKSISHLSGYSIYQALTKRKFKRINRSAQVWLRVKKLQNLVYRIEFIGIINYPDKYYLEHFKYLEFI